MSHSRFCLFALFAVLLAVTLSEAAPQDQLSEAAPKDQSDVEAWMTKVTKCVEEIDKSQLTQIEINILLGCVVPAVTIPPWIPGAISVRYLTCVGGLSTAVTVADAADQVVLCVLNSF